jgi:septum site-determining protein MinC
LLIESITVLDLRERQANDIEPGEILGTVRDAGIRLAAVLIGEPNEREALANLDLPVIEVPLPASNRPVPASAEEQVTAGASGPAAVEQPAAQPLEQSPKQSDGQQPDASPAGQQSHEQPPAQSTEAPAQQSTEGPVQQSTEDSVQQSTEQSAGQSTEHSTEQPAAQPKPHPVIEELPPAGIAPLYLTRPLRSGQRFYAQGRDAVVAARTSRGSELLADGSIYAFSPLRGRVLAGASGDTSACIVATHLDAELVAVAGVYRTFEADELKAHSGGPVSVTWSLDADGNERLTLAALTDSSSIKT